MNTITIYYLEKAYKNYYKNKGQWQFPIEAFKQGAGFDECEDCETIEIFTNKEEALAKLKKCRTHYWTLTNSLCDYLQVSEYAVIKHQFELEEIIENEKDITNKEEFIKTLKLDPYAYWDYCDIRKDCVCGYSTGTITAWVKVQTYCDGEYKKHVISKDFKNDNEFNAYLLAVEWKNMKFEELCKAEDITYVQPIDYGIIEN